MNQAAFGSLPSDACVPGTAGAHGPDRITRNFWDNEGRLNEVRRAWGTPLEQVYAAYTYSTNGLRTSVTDAEGNRAELRYDGYGRQVRWVFPHPSQTGAVNEADYEAYGYDDAGNRTSLRKRDGVTINYAYDALNRMTQKTVPQSANGAAGYSVHYGYDVGDRQTFARFGSASGPGVTNGYDGFGRLSTTTTNMDGTSRTLASQYDAGSRRRVLWDMGVSYSGAYSYDPAGRLTRYEEGLQSLAFLPGYDALGRRTSLVFGVGIAASTVSYAYDPVGRLASLGHDLAGTASDQSLGFSYNPASQIATRTASNDAYRSTSAYAVNRSYAVNGLNQYTQAGPASFLYDLNGNLTSDGSTTYVYDAENRLVSASGASNATLSYDPLGRLWQVSGSSGTTRFHYDGDDLIQERDGNGTLLRAYVHGPGAGDEPLMWYEYTNGWSRRYLHADHQGSIVAVSESSGSAFAINGYDAWGIPNANNQGRFGYTGQTWIPELGLWHYKARVYSPTLGRFLQTDPVGYDDQINLYAYVGNDPVNRVDPDGRCYANAFAVAGGAAAADGPAPAGEVVGAAILTGACIYRGYRFIASLMSGRGEGHRSQDDEGRIVTNQEGRVKGDLPDPDDVPEEHTGPSIRALNQSIRAREEEVRNHPRGNPNGTRREQREHRERVNHEERIRRERELRDRLIERSTRR